MLFAAAAALVAGTAEAREIVSTPAYSWVGDTIFQNEFRAWAPDDYHLVSTYAAQPGYFMPVEKEWKVRNDLSAYPKLK